MRSETDTPVDQRFLWIEGSVSPKSMALIKAGLPEARPCDTAIVFVGFAYADLPVPKQFDVIFPRRNPQDGIHCQSRIIAVTQQFAKPFQEIPHGWKTVCMIQFVGGIPETIRKLPEVDSWFQNDEWACVCGNATWELLKSRDSI
jgi:hypothetical protein